MSTRNLDKLMAPKSVVAIGASVRPGSVGAAVTRNLLAGGFHGKIYLVNVKGGEIADHRVYRTLSELPEVPDLAVVMTPAETIPRLIMELGERGTRVAVVISAGPGNGVDGAKVNARWRQQVLRAARPHLLRVIGPNTIGYAMPKLGLNASFGPGNLKAGRIAAVAQSGAVLAGLADWGAAQGIGFSHLVSMGDMSDVDFGDVLDMLARDADTRAVLMYIEGITHARKFMSAARGVARIKPVIVLKAGRHAAAAKAAASHTGSMAGSAAVYNAAFARAGLVRVTGLGELFDAAETLGYGISPRTERLAILTNGGGVGIIATDLLLDEGGELAALLPKTLGQLDRHMPRAWSRGNPVDIVGDADGPRYAAALDALADDRGVGAVLAMNVPTALTSSEDAGRAIAGAAGAKVVPVIGCWIGGPAAAGREVLHAAGMPAYDTPLRAVRGFMHTVQYRRGQRALQRTPPSVPEARADTKLVRAIVHGALADKRSILTEPEAKRVLAAYGIPVVPTEIVLDAAEAAAAAVRIGFPVAVKILSRQITHKSDVGGVALDLVSEQAVVEAVRTMTGKALVKAPKARIDGFVVQPMIKRPNAVELILGAAEDPVFGPILMVGHGGVAAEVVDDKALALPPLDLVLAEDALSRTRVDRLLRGYRDRPPAARGAVGEAMVRLSQLIADVGEIAELDINPLLADADGVLALDARIVVRKPEPGQERAARFAIRPYPVELETAVRHGEESLRIRPIRPQDEALLDGFVRRLSREDVRMRFFGPLRELSHEMAARLTQIDYDREMAFLLMDGEILVGVGRLAADPDFEQAEFALVVASDRQGRGYGTLLLTHVLHYAKSRGIKRVIGHVLRENDKMLALIKRLGFRREGMRSGEPDLRVVKSLGAL